MSARSYLDHASTSPLRPAARDAMIPWLEAAAVGDPSRIHVEGLTARAAVEAAREQVATLFGCRSSREVVFTSGATESVTAAAWGALDRGRHQVVTAVEHSAVRAAAAAAAPSGEVSIVGVDSSGRIDVDALIDSIRPETALVHVQWANHEVGTLQPVADAVAACHERGVLVHVDAATAAGHVPVAFAELGADLLSLSAHKLGGPQGAGALLIRRGLRLRALLAGGEQERARRAGLENVPAIVGFGAACESVDVQAEGAAQRALTGRVLEAVPGLDGVVIYGDPSARVPHLVCLGVLGIEPQAVLLGLDRAGIAAHSGSACSSEALEPSPVLEAMGLDAHRSLRISVGWSSKDADIDALLSALPDVIARLRALGPS